MFFFSSYQVFGTFIGRLQLHRAIKVLYLAFLIISNAKSQGRDVKTNWQLAGKRTVGARCQQRSPRPLLPDLDLQEVFHLSFRIPANLWNLGSRASDAPMGFSKLRGCRNRAPSHGDSAFRNAEESPNKETSQAVSTMWPLLSLGAKCHPRGNTYRTCSSSL